MSSNLISDERGLAKVWLVLVIVVLIGGAGTGGYFAAKTHADSELSDKQSDIDRLKKKLRDIESPSPQPGASASAAPQAQGGNQAASQTTNYQSANLGFAATVPADWVGKWRYQENGQIGISTSSVTFFLINKETKYAEVVTIGKIPQDKYNDARATNQPVGNADNLLKEANGFSYVLTFPDGSQGDFKDFTYAQATKAAKDSLKSSFNLL